MPEELLRNRNDHEKEVYAHEPERKPGTGKVEKFRKFILGLFRKQDERFWTFHNAVSANRVESIKGALADMNDREMETWLQMYLNKSGT